MVHLGAVDDAAVGQFLHIVGIVSLFDGQMCARGWIACRDGPRGGGRLAGSGTEDLVLGAGTLQCELQALVVRLQRVGAGL